MSQNKTADFNIVICPPVNIKRRAILLSKSLKNKDSLFCLDNTSHYPHISVYMVPLPLKLLPQVKKSLQQIAVKQKSFLGESGKYRLSSSGYIDISYKRTLALVRLQKLIIKKINKYRGHIIRKSDLSRLSQLSAAEKQNVKKYGYRYVGKQFVPHLTLARFNKVNNILNKLSRQKFSFQVSEIGLYYLGDHGTCRKEAIKYKFGNL